MQETLQPRARPVSQLPGVKCHKLSGALRLEILCRNPVNEFLFIFMKYCGGVPNILKPCKAKVTSDNYGPKY